MTEHDHLQENSKASPIESLRIERTKLTQDELAVRCGIPRSTYQRWIAGRTEAKLSLTQLKALCQELGIERVDELPDGFCPRLSDRPP
ncbi:helix-turn-helix domain-containing protein [Leptolyngbya sp. AN02str]|uniref:helix-turn-helix domain-containing protein n=1 Tax=Leptolyngbya sp. AN02str TaxID=3423363 RepID=UPI003D31F6E3